MADPTYYTGNAVNRTFRGLVKDEPFGLDSATISVWKPDDTKVVDEVSMTVNGSLATYSIPGANTPDAGTYTVEATLVFGQSQGPLTFQETFAVVARKT